ncbi:MAG TPA: glycosyltransferase [Verrucomicrobiae bacterium]|nr:glycosyltransferase [Verrucomicrobiae bacterium]
MISFIVPAHNEEAWVGRCVSAIRNGAESLGEPYEIIVVDDGSSDATASIAQQQGAQVVRVEHRQIAATRNTGAQQAHGDILFFVDADTLASAPAIQSALCSIRAGAVGGGCVPRFEGWLPWWGRLTEPLIGPAMRLARFLPSGTFLFCTRSAFQTTGGFDENYFAWEEVWFVAALKRQGRFAILAETVVTSGRKFREHSFWSISRLCMHLILRRSRALRSRKGLEYWYEPERGKVKL